jgi:hypothetical protein
MVDGRFVMKDTILCPKHGVDFKADRVVFERPTLDGCSVCDDEFSRSVVEMTDRQIWLNKIQASDIVYVSGPMSGIQDFNRPAFWLMEHVLKRRGCSILSPAHYEGEHSYEWYMREDFEKVLDATTMVMLQGWKLSRGANIEHDMGSVLGLAIFEQI